jgi:hypothetical protein
MTTSPQIRDLRMAVALGGAEYSTMDVIRHDVLLPRELDLFATYHAGCRTFGPIYTAITKMNAEGLIDPGSNSVHRNTIADAEFRCSPKPARL